MSYDELENYYDIVEHEVGVSGRAGNIMGKVDARGNVFEGPRRRDFPMPPLRDTEFTDMMGAAAKKMGWKPFRGPAAINSVPYRGRPGVRLSRLLRSRRVPYQREEFDCGDDHSRSRQDEESDDCR